MVERRECAMAINEPAYTPHIGNTHDANNVAAVIDIVGLGEIGARKIDSGENPAAVNKPMGGNLARAPSWTSKVPTIWPAALMPKATVAAPFTVPAPGTSKS